MHANGISWITHGPVCHLCSSFALCPTFTSLSSLYADRLPQTSQLFPEPWKRETDPLHHVPFTAASPHLTSLEPLFFVFPGNTLHFLIHLRILIQWVLFFLFVLLDLLEFFWVSSSSLLFHHGVR